MPRYDHQERLTALEAMEHAYFFPVIKEHSRSVSIRGALRKLNPKTFVILTISEYVKSECHLHLRLSASGGSPTVAAGLAGSQGPSSPTLPPGKEMLNSIDSVELEFLFTDAENPLSLGVLIIP